MSLGYTRRDESNLRKRSSGGHGGRFAKGRGRSASSVSIGQAEVEGGL